MDTFVCNRNLNLLDECECVSGHMLNTTDDQTMQTRQNFVAIRKKN